VENSLRISEVFQGIQGEGRFAGTPMLFIRLSGCNRKCPFCDTKYHVNGKKVSIQSLVRRILRANFWTVCITGGEVLLQRDAVHNLVWEVRKKSQFIQFHLETNGDLLTLFDFDVFDYIVISPKSVQTAKRVNSFRVGKRVVRSDVKVVTDLDKVGVSMLPYVNMLMPLTVFNRCRDAEIRQKVWEYCIKHRVNYSPRLHYEIWGPKRGK